MWVIEGGTKTEVMPLANLYGTKAMTGIEVMLHSATLEQNVPYFEIKITQED